MCKPLKTFDATLAEEMQNPEFREGFLQAKSELEEFACVRDMRRSSDLSEELVAQRTGTSQSVVSQLEVTLLEDR